MREGMVIINVSGFEENKKISPIDERRKILEVRKSLFRNLVLLERENVLGKLKVKFKGLKYEDLEEIYDDGCLVLWDKMMDMNFELREECLVGYLVKICRNIGMHYLRKVNDDVMSLDKIMERGFGGVKEGENGLDEMFDILNEKEKDEEKYKKLEKVWNNLKEVDRIILESYYLEGCKMDEIAKRIGYRNGDSVKSKKSRVLKRMMKKIKEEADSKNLPLVA